jgi:hypothetical protein
MMQSAQQIRAQLADWYAELSGSLMSHHGRLGQGFEHPAGVGQFSQWLEQYAQQHPLDEASRKALERLYAQLERELARLLERQRQLLKSRLAHVGIERSYRQLDQLLAELESDSA